VWRNRISKHKTTTIVQRPLNPEPWHRKAHTTRIDAHIPPHPPPSHLSMEVNRRAIRCRRSRSPYGLENTTGSLSSKHSYLGNCGEARDGNGMACPNICWLHCCSVSRSCERFQEAENNKRSVANTTY